MSAEAIERIESLIYTSQTALQLQIDELKSKIQTLEETISSSHLSDQAEMEACSSQNLSPV